MCSCVVENQFLNMYVSEKVLSHLQVRSMKIPHNFSTHCWNYSPFSKRVSTFLNKSSSTFEQGHVYLPSNSRSAAADTCNEPHHLPNRVLPLLVSKVQTGENLTAARSVLQGRCGSRVHTNSAIECCAHLCVCVWSATVMVELHFWHFSFGTN